MSKNQTCCPSGLLRMHIGKVTLRRAISAIISRVGSFGSATIKIRWPPAALSGLTTVLDTTEIIYIENAVTKIRFFGLAPCIHSQIVQDRTQQSLANDTNSNSSSRVFEYCVIIVYWLVLTDTSCGPNNCIFWAMTESEGEVEYP